MGEAIKTELSDRQRIDEIARLETALRAGDLVGEAAREALDRVHELMSGRPQPEAASDIEYIVA